MIKGVLDDGAYSASVTTAASSAEVRVWCTRDEMGEEGVSPELEDHRFSSAFATALAR